MIPTRNEWKRFRDSHKDSPGEGAVSGVSVGKLCDLAAKAHDSGSLEAVAKAYPKLVKDLDAYAKKVGKKHPKFAKDLDAKIIKQAKLFGADAIRVAKPAKYLKKTMQIGLKFIEKPELGQSLENWSKFHADSGMQSIENMMKDIISADAKVSKKMVPILTIWQRVMIETDPNKVANLNAASAHYQARRVMTTLYKQLKKDGIF